jgi:hypothetical protein
MMLHCIKFLSLVFGFNEPKVVEIGVRMLKIMQFWFQLFLCFSGQKFPRFEADNFYGRPYIPV